MGTEHSCVCTRRQEGVRCLSHAHSICACLTVWVYRIPHRAACSSYLFQPALLVLRTCLSDSLKVLGWACQPLLNLYCSLGAVLSFPACSSQCLLLWHVFMVAGIYMKALHKPHCVIKVLWHLSAPWNTRCSSDAQRVETQLWFSTYAQWWHLAA